MDHLTYPITEIFSSRQGEGFNTGSPAVFVRLHGCNRSCSWCDERDKSHTHMTVDEIVNEVNTIGSGKPVIFTGGEPTIHNLNRLVAAFGVPRSRPLWIESNGTSTPYIYSQFDYVAVSPKLEDIRNGVMDKYAHFSHEVIDEIRVVVDDNVTFEDLIRLNFFRRKYLSPVFDGTSFSHGLKLLYPLYNALKDAGWQISLQTHKLANIQ